MLHASKGPTASEQLLHYSKVFWRMNQWMVKQYSRNQWNWILENISQEIYAKYQFCFSNVAEKSALTILNFPPSTERQNNRPTGRRAHREVKLQIIIITLYPLLQMMWRSPRLATVQSNSALEPLRKTFIPHSCKKTSAPIGAFEWNFPTF